MPGMRWETILGLVGVVLVFTSSSGLDPLKGWCRSRAHGFWGWFAAILGDSMLVGFWAGLGWGVYSEGNIFHVFMFGGITAMACYVSEELLTILGSIARSVVRRFSVPARVQQQVQQPPPSAHDPKISEADAHAIMDDFDGNDPKSRIQKPG